MKNTYDIVLPNRYNNSIKLVPTDNSKSYKLNIGEECNYVRIGYEGAECPKEGTIRFIDPEGGPFLSKGTKISEDLIIDSVVKTNDGYIINFE